jgi:hypothetical protein
MRPEEIDKRVKQAKEELYRVFADKPNFRYWWKEEDLQSYLYCLLVKKIGTKLVHREYPLVKRFKPRNWVAMIDLVVLKPFRGRFDYHKCKIRHAIQLKFPRVYSTGFSSGKVNELKSNYERDQEKLLSKAENVIKGFHKHLLFFRRLKDRRHVKESQEKRDELLKDKRIQFSYMEIYLNDEKDEHPRLFNNCGLKKKM